MSDDEMTENEYRKLRGNPNDEEPGMDELLSAIMKPLERELAAARVVANGAMADRDALKAENARLRKHWDACIEIIRDFPLDHRLSDRAMTLYKQWIDDNKGA